VQESRLGDLKSATAGVAQAYLAERQESGLSQKTLDQDRQALQCHLGQKLERVQALEVTKLSTRSYTTAQIREITSHQTGRNALATEIAHSAGLRASELQTIRPASERPASTHRQWSEDRFNGRVGERYTVQGKGGLIREVLIPREIAARLEAARLPKAVNVTDRGVYYQQHYAIGGGKNWATSFSRVSENRLGWSNGAHGLRHSYAQERMNELQGSNGYTYEKALSTVAQELGHFSPSTTEAYLR
jgi:integrase